MAEEDVEYRDEFLLNGLFDLADIKRYGLVEQILENIDVHVLNRFGEIMS